jgi:hypothetical protein
MSYYLSKTFSVLLTALFITTGGCSMLGAGLAKTIGDPSIPAQYTLQQTPLVIMVENYRNPDLSAADAELLARTLYKKLDAKKLAPLVPYEKILNLRNLRPADFRKMSVAAIGRDVGADQILYIDFQAGGLVAEGSGNVYQGKATVLVKVIDAKTGESRWPIEAAEGRIVTAETNLTQGTDTRNAGRVRIALYDKLADTIARLFYKYKLDEVPE